MNKHIPIRKRSYDDGCAVAQIMDVIGERWAMLVMRELMFGPKRFTDLRADLPGISANVLTQRLEGLEAAGILRRRKLPPPAGSQVYELTDWGDEAEILFRVIGRWAARSPFLAPAPMSASSAILSMRTMFCAEKAGDLRCTLGLHLDGRDFTATVAEGLLTIEPGQADRPDAVISGSPDMLVRALYGGEPVEALMAQQALAITGNVPLVQRYCACFPLPHPAPPPGG
ncbi:MAG: winged helix-turn-helix transcriptional regulator [Sphingobium sp.]